MTEDRGQVRQEMISVLVMSTTQEVASHQNQDPSLPSLTTRNKHPSLKPWHLLQQRRPKTHKYLSTLI
ncbi:hypothetical protein I79_003283 [Cricetulus griseus]|uniref:Uncharacterized protein n=1 Tax=Cricetulus griseus TaxID=10029 RepID=G3GZK8_CRIGR|nr:hypothetical protein I79_003283 [Cricetulus griseus]